METLNIVLYSVIFLVLVLIGIVAFLYVKRKNNKNVTQAIDETTIEQVKEKISQTSLETLETKLEKPVEKIQETIDTLPQTITENVLQPVKDTLDEKTELVKETIEKLPEGIQEKAEETIEKIVDNEAVQKVTDFVEDKLGVETNAIEKDEKLDSPVETELRTEKPESVPSRMTRLRSRLAQSGSFGKTLLNLLSKNNLSERDWEEIEDTLLMADLGMEPTMTLMDSLRNRVKIENTDDVNRVKEILHEELLKLVDPNMDRSLNIEANIDASGNKKPASIIMVGVNGVGKTTTAGKLSRVLVAENKTVLLGAADTFRAAAGEQLKTWGERTGVEVVGSDKEGADPASVAFDAVKKGAEKQVDVVIVDTAGRLQNKKDLMDELGKIKRVMSKEVEVNETLLVLDATTGQNGMKQAEVFAQVADVTGIVLTKLDGTAKGGIVVSVQKALGVPVKFVGLGEGVDDLAPFDADAFVKALLS